jgi:hypothetical protein
MDRDSLTPHSLWIGFTVANIQDHSESEGCTKYVPVHAVQYIVVVGNNTRKLLYVFAPLVWCDSFSDDPDGV